LLGFLKNALELLVGHVDFGRRTARAIRILFCGLSHRCQGKNSTAHNSSDEEGSSIHDMFSLKRKDGYKMCIILFDMSPAVQFLAN
jgi:hypothetical protein